MKKFTDITARMVVIPVVSFTLAHGPVQTHASEYLLPHPDHTEERTSSYPERLVGRASVILRTSSGTLSSSLTSWPPLPPLDGPPFTLA